MKDVNEGSDVSLYGRAVIDHNTFHGVGGSNKTCLDLKFLNSTSTITNTTISDVSGKAINVLNSDSVLVDYSNWYNVGDGPSNQWTDGGHNLEVDPLFTDASTGDLTLLETSPLIGAGSDSSTIGDPRWAPQAPNIDPVNTTAPQLSGTTVEGDTLNVDNGVWTDDNDDVLTFTYTWYTDSDNQGNDGTVIANATDNTYTLTNADVDLYIYAMVTADDGNGGSVGISSNYSTQVSTLGIGDEIIITEYSLSQNYPNPFNPVTEITFALPNTGDISLKVFNMVGQEVALIASGNYPAGLHTLSFNGVDLPSGIYFYTLTGAGVNVTKKMILMK
tara:strand:+ start:82 stop:1077 length:996 start_codon:yes stop_codon:yes gene_type:complete